MHHSSESDRDMKRRLESLESNALKLGATGNFPEGKLTEHDEGEIKIAIGTTNGKVVIEFGKPVAWLGLDAKQARQLAESLRQMSYRVEAKK